MSKTFTINESEVVHQGQISCINRRLTLGAQMCEPRCFSCYLFSVRRWWMSQRLARCPAAWPVWRDSLRTRSLPRQPLTPASHVFITSRDLCRWEGSRKISGREHVCRCVYGLPCTVTGNSTFDKCALWVFLPRVIPKIWMWPCFPLIGFCRLHRNW